MAHNQSVDGAKPGLHVPHILTLGIVAGVSPMAMNIFLPSMPSMARSLDVSYAQVQYGLTVYLFAIAVMQLILGPMSDRFGRRPVLLFGFAGFMLGSVVCATAPTIEILYLGRILQATSAVGISLSRTIVRDLFPPSRAASMIGYVTMCMTLAPMFAPLIGGWIDENYGWRYSFWLLFAAGLITLCLTLADVKETNTNLGMSVRDQLRAYVNIGKIPILWIYILAASTASGTYFAMLGGVAYVADTHLQLTPTQTGVAFLAIATGYLSGNFLTGKLAQTTAPEKLMLIGALIATVGVLLPLLFEALGVLTPVLFFTPIFLVGLGNGLTLPNITVAAIGLSPHAAGAVSGLLGSMQISIGGLASILPGHFLTEASGPAPLLYIMLISAVLSVLLIMIISRKARLSEATV